MKTTALMIAITVLISLLASAGGVNRVSASVGPGLWQCAVRKLPIPIHPSAYYYNPAGLVIVENTALQCGMETRGSPV